MRMSTDLESVVLSPADLKKIRFVAKLMGVLSATEDCGDAQAAQESLNAVLAKQEGEDKPKVAKAG